MRQPIQVRGHSLIDYGFTAVNVVGPPLLGLRGAACGIPLAFAATQGSLNALTDQRYAARRLVPFKLHGRSESLAVPLPSIAVVGSGALDQPKAKPFLLGLLAALGAVCTLTDWDAEAPK